MPSSVLVRSAGTKAATGDFGFKVFSSSDPAEKTKKLSAELANGILAMMPIIGMIIHDGLIESGRGDCALYSACPLHAFEKEFGVQGPVGFCCLLASRLLEFKELRSRGQTEREHGRVSMVAAIGYITKDVTGKLLGYWAPSAGLNLVTSLTTGCGQILAYGAFCELSHGQSAGTKVAAGDFGFKVLTSSDPSEKTSILSAELGSGRLARMAIIGMFYRMASLALPVETALCTLHPRCARTTISWAFRRHLAPVILLASRLMETPRVAVLLDVISYGPPSVRVRSACDGSRLVCL